MSYIQQGVLEKSKMFFFSTTQNKALFYYPVSAGHFYCTRGYKIQRDNFDSILVTYIVNGSFSFSTDAGEVTAKSGEIALIDCYVPHIYYTNDEFEAYWLHIGGSNTYEIFKDLTRRVGHVIKSTEESRNLIKGIYSSVKNNEIVLSESKASLQVYTLLMTLFDCRLSYNDGDSVSETVRFINENYSNNITVNDIAENAHLSPSQFSRRFKTNTGASPYEYLLSVRLMHAKELLKNTSLPISEIAFRTGFLSDSNFIYFFKKREGISPLKFRKILF